MWNPVHCECCECYLTRKFYRSQKSQRDEDLRQNGSLDFNNKQFWQLPSWNWNWFDLKATCDLFRAARYVRYMYVNTGWLLDLNSIHTLQNCRILKNITGSKSNGDWKCSPGPHLSRGSVNQTVLPQSTNSCRTMSSPHSWVSKERIHIFLSAEILLK